MSDPCIDIRNISRHYVRGESVVKALDGISFSIDKGEFVAIVGSSGSGKSTVLNLIAGLDTPTAGEILIDGSELVSMKPRDKARLRADKIGMVFQSFNLISQHSALTNIEMGLLFDNIPKPKRQERALAVIEKLGLSGRANHRPADLSGGEQQRVAFARAMVKSPEILLADEPTGNLDKDNTDLIIDLLKELNNDGQTVIMVTHDMQIAEWVADRIIKLSYGTVESNTKQENGSN